MPSARGLITRAFQPRWWVLYDQGLVSGANFFTMLYLGRKLELEAFGLFTLAYMSVVFLGTLQTALMTQPMNLIGAVKEESSNTGHLVSLQRLHLVAWLPLNVLLLGGIAYLFFPDPGLALAAVIYLCAFQLQELLRRYWYTCDRISDAFVNDAISYGTQVVGLVVLGQFFFIDGAAAFYVLAVTSLLAVGAGWWRLRSTPREPMPIPILLTEHWKLGSWLMLGTLSSFAAIQLHPYMLAGLGAGLVAVFAASRNILSALNVFVQAANNYLPIKAKQVLHREGLEGLWRYLARIGTMMFLTAAVFCAGVMIWAEELLQLIYGGNFAGSENILRILAIGVLGWTMFPPIYAGILALGYTSTVFISNTVATVFTVTVGWWLILQYGVVGAAVAANASVFLILAIQIVRLRASVMRSMAGQMPAREGGR